MRLQYIFLFSIFMLIIVGSISAQKTIAHISDTRDLLPYALAEADNGDLIVAGRYTDERFKWPPEYSDTLRAFIMRFSADGELKKENFLDEEITGEFEDVIILESGDILAVGGLVGTNGEVLNHNQMRVSKFDENLDLIWVKLYNPAVSSLSKIIKVDENEFWCFGSSYEHPAYTMLKINADGDSLDFRMRFVGESIQGNPLKKIHNIIYEEGKCYVLYKGDFSSGNRFSVDVFDGFHAQPDSIPTAFWTKDQDDSGKPPFYVNGLAVDNEYTYVNASYNVEMVGEVGGDKVIINLDKTYLSKTDLFTKEKSLKSILRSEERESLVDITPGGVSSNGEHLFFAINYNRSIPPMLELKEYPDKKTRIFFKMMTASGDVIDEEIHDGNAYDVSYSVINTKDNAFVAVGSRFVHGDEAIDTRDLILVKFFEKLNTDNKEINQSKLIVYPNPSASIFNFKYPEQNKPYVVYDAIGNVLLKGKTSPDNTIDLTGYDGSVFLLKIGNQTVKMVKAH